MTGKFPILCLDFDGVIHSYTSGWQGATVIPDPPVPGALRFICDAVDRFRVAIYSSRSAHPGGIRAMETWLREHMEADIANSDIRFVVLRKIEWPTCKPSAFVTLDDRAIMFTGHWPELDELAAFKPWNKKDKKSTP